ncbi:ANTAR domain-containing protein [Amycolatopsis japonica]|uniref:ANTAR domain-containing protein n=1 Tax=Amycolatopsis japonica TaxID=208439 RepID=UPI0033201DBD
MERGDVLITPLNVESALVLSFSGAVSAGTGPDLASRLGDVVAVLPPPPLVVLDLRMVTELSAAGARVLVEFARSRTEEGVRFAAVLGSGSVASRVLRLQSSDAVLPVYASVDAAVSSDTADADAPVRDLDVQLAALTRVLLGADTVEQALRQVVAAAVAVLPHARVVSVTLRDPEGRFSTPIQTDSVATELDRIQYTTGRGPCVEVSRPDSPGYVLAQDLTGPTAWPQFSAVATAHGYGSVLSTALQPLTRPAGAGGALNIYSHRNGFTGDDRHRALLLATHATLALARGADAEIADLERRQLHRAIESRDVIGQAKGILMARQGLTAGEAFDLLRRTSQDLNVKLTDIAATLTERHNDLVPSEGEPAE